MLCITSKKVSAIPSGREDISPLRPGVYRVKPSSRDSRRLAYAAWDGTSWSGARRQTDELDNMVSHDHAAHGWRPWRGLSEEGINRVSLLLGALQRRNLARSNLDGLESLRTLEAAVESARATAFDEYRRLIAVIDRSSQELSARQALRDKLDQLARAGFDAPTEPTFDESLARTDEDADKELRATRESAGARVIYWQDYWLTARATHPALAEGLASGGLVVGYGEGMKARLGKHASMRPVPGSFGTKRR